MIWQIGNCTPRDVYAMYPDPKPHINTIATMFQSLERKGYLTHQVKGRGYLYIPTMDQKDYGRGKFETFVSRYFGSSYMNVVSTLVREEKVTEEELEQFLRELKKRGVIHTLNEDALLIADMDALRRLAEDERA